MAHCILLFHSGWCKRYGEGVELDALVVLGCRLEPGGRLSPAAERRVRLAAHAFRGGASARVVVSGGRRWHGVAEAEAMARALTLEQVPEASLMLELLSASTAENALYSARLLPARATVGVVTCDWHMRRALDCFRRAGLVPHAFAAASPPLRAPRRLARRVREELSTWLDRAATWGG